MNQVIGILGGMGPRATVQFEHMLLDRLPGSDQELPVIITINDGGIPDRSDFLLGKGPDPVPRLQSNLRVLKQAGATVICVPCNTACAPRILGRLTYSDDTTVLNLPRLAIEHLISTGARKVVLLATTGTIRANVYQQLCAENDIDSVLPGALLQQQVMEVIRLVKQGNTTRARLAAKPIRSFLESQRDSVALLGCTELPLVQGALIPAGSQAIDTLAILADACVQYLQQDTKELIV